MTPPALQPDVVNVAQRLAAHAAQRPQQLAIIQPDGRTGDRYRYRQMTFAELDQDSNRIASGLARMGVAPGTRMALLVRPSLEFISLVYALLKSGAVMILIDPGMGRKNLVRCLAEAEPEGFIAVSLAQAVRSLLRRRFPRTRHLVTVGPRLWWGGKTLGGLRRGGSPDTFLHRTRAEQAAAIIFTTGSTGIPKGVLYCHGNFDSQVTQLRERFQIPAGDIDLATFPLFGLFNSAMGVTTVIPDMDATRPAHVDPQNIIAHIQDWQIKQSFGSPALWDRIGRFCEQNNVRLECLDRVFSAGAPVPGHVLARMKGCLRPEAEIYTPYGATEALPVSVISSREVLEVTQQQTDIGAGVCVGKKFPGIQWRVVRIVDGPIRTMAEAEQLGQGEIGELVVCGPVVTERYVTVEQANRLGKIHDGDLIWHRMGDVGYLDHDEQFWFCGRLAHRVKAADSTMFTICCEAVFNTLAHVNRCALVGVGAAPQQRPVLVVEPSSEHFPTDQLARAQFKQQLRSLGQQHAHTLPIKDFIFRRRLPVDIRHNAKIFREKLRPWAAAQLRYKELTD